MGSKHMILAMTLGLLGLAFAACKTPHSSQSLTQAVASADSLLIYQVEEYPIAPAEQVSGQYYLHDYAMHGKQALSAAQIAELKAILLDPTTFDTTAVKSCPMLPKMAIDLQRKGKSSMTLILSPAPCGKVLVFGADPRARPTPMELTPGNKLEAMVFGATK
jgi:hypothetical protein